MSDSTNHHGTAEICDLHAEILQVVRVPLVSYGGKDRCSGSIVTVKMDGDNRVLKSLLSTPGEKRIAVVDAGGVFCAVVGDNLAALAIANSWGGIILNGYVRDTRALARMPIGVWALGTCPCRSARRSQGETNAVLHFGGARFETNNFIYVDEDGLVVADQPFRDIVFEA